VGGRCRAGKKLRRSSEGNVAKAPDNVTTKKMKDEKLEKTKKKGGITS
jgi:hypothetical protein